MSCDVINLMCPCKCHHSMSFAYCHNPNLHRGPGLRRCLKANRKQLTAQRSPVQSSKSESIGVNVSISFQYVSRLPLHILQYLTISYNVSFSESFQCGMSAPGSAYLRGDLRGTGGDLRGSGGTGPYGLCQRAVVATRAWSDGFCRHGVGSTAQRLSWETREATGGALRISGKIIEWYRMYYDFFNLFQFNILYFDIFLLSIFENMLPSQWQRHLVSQ